MLKITAPGGESNLVVITDTETGADIGKAIAFSAVDIRLRGGHPVTATGEVVIMEPDLEVERFDWTTKHPLRPNDRYQPLAALEFRDGIRVTFREDGAPIVTEPTPDGERTYGDEIHDLIASLDRSDPAAYAADMRKVAAIALKAAGEAGGGPAVTETVTLRLKFDARGILHELARQMFGDDVSEPAEDVTVEEMVTAIVAQIRLRAAEVPAGLLGNVAVVRPIGPDGQPVEVKPADFWTWLRPASIDRTVAGLERTWAAVGTVVLPGGPDASVRIERGAEGRYHVSAGPHSWRGEGIEPALGVAATALTSAATGVQASDINACGESQPAAYVTIQRWGTNYDVSTGPDATGGATGLAGQVDINAALNFAREHLTLGVSDEVVHAEPAGAA